MRNPTPTVTKQSPWLSLLTIASRNSRWFRIVAVSIIAFSFAPQFSVAQCNPQKPKPPVAGPNYSYPSASEAEKEIPKLGQSFSDGGVSRAFLLAQNEYEKKIRRIRFKYLAGNKKLHEPSREHGLAELEKFTDPTAVQPLIEVLRGEGPFVRDWLLDHLAYRVDEPYGQAAVTWLSIYDKDETMRDAARLRLTGEPNERSQFVIDQALRLKNDLLVDNAALAAGKFKLVQAIPLLIAAQAGGTASSPASSRQGNGALAFIQIQKQRFFVSDLQPVVGTNSAGFDPTLSVLQEGTVMVIDDAVVEFVRPRTHQTLLDLVRDSYGQPVDFGYNYPKWRNWYQSEYLPTRQAQAKDDAPPEDPTSDNW